MYVHRLPVDMRRKHEICHTLHKSNQFITTIFNGFRSTFLCSIIHELIPNYNFKYVIVCLFKLNIYNRKRTKSLYRVRLRIINFFSLARQTV